MVGDGMRIGDSERDEAVSMLQEHHAEGRLSTEEFDERMGKALEARVGSDLVALFFDLPAPRPGLARSSAPQPEPVVAPWAGAPQAPATWGADDDQLQHRPMARPWFAQWWIILPFVIMGVAFALIGERPTWLRTYAITSSMARRSSQSSESTTLK